MSAAVPPAVPPGALEAFAAGLDAALARAERTGAAWLLVGSAASWLQGVNLLPGDVDFLARSPDDLDALAAGFADLLVDGRVLGANEYPEDAWRSTRGQPVLHYPGATASSAFFRVTLPGPWGGLKVEGAFLFDENNAGKLMEAQGEAVWAAARRVSWRGHPVPVAP
ncbi:MAG TPA: hypothetical protein VHN99_10860, partial [Deinococcales bacterium]|nr:hypothetical protein [Deinococcales bacterium]